MSHNRRFVSYPRIEEYCTYFVYLFGAAILLMLFWFHYPTFFLSVQVAYFNPIVEQSHISGMRKNFTATKWIVLTSIQHPTDDVKNLANQPDWTVVVVADKKTPRSWSLPGVHFLSVEDQASYGSFARLLPFSSYTRKNIGYLYAMANGADWIYDTDDDNKPYGKGLQQFDYQETVSGLIYAAKSKNIARKLFNPYQFYGYSKMWPRGFPLEYLRDHTNGNDTMVLCRKMRTAAVQQGIVHNDPDVDAIYRVTDIWRSYFAQKLLHLIGEHVAFYPVNAVQFRNAHDYLSDFDQEVDVYEKSGKIVEFLDQWNCSEKTIDLCMLQLATEFVQHRFFKEPDYLLIEGWLGALKELNYSFAPLVNLTTSLPDWRNKTMFGNCREANLDLGVRDYDPKRGITEGMSRTDMAVKGYEEILDWCSLSSNKTYEKLPQPKNLETIFQNGTLQERQGQVLVLVNNYPWKNSMALLQRIYSPFFATTIFCGSWYPHWFQNDSLPMLTPANFVNITIEEMQNGYAYHFCFSKIRDLRLQNVKGYLFLSDDSIFNFWREFPTNKVYNPYGIDKLCYWWTDAGGKNMVDLLRTRFANDSEAQATLKLMKERLPSNFTSIADLMGKCTGKTAGDVIYIPAREMDYMANLVEIILPSGIFVEDAIGKIMRTVDYEKGDFFYDWGMDGKRGFRYSAYKKSRLGLHPLKLSFAEKDLAVRKQFCDVVISTFVKGIFRGENP